VADTAQKAILQVKKELGKDALILHSRPFKEGGFLGLFAKKRFEVLAAVDENAERARVRASLNFPAPNWKKPTPSGGEAKVEKAGTGILPEIQLLRKELEELRQAVEGVSKRVQADSETQQANVNVAAGKGAPRRSPDGSENRFFSSESAAIVESVAEHVAEHVEKKLVPSERSAKGKKLRLALPAPAPIKIESKPTVVVLIGPTGVGKTTTIAKLAANFALFEGKSVGLITIDTYRIAAVEQLKTYAEIINLPIEVVYTVGEFKKALSKLGDKDLILVDTAGRSQKNKQHIRELRQFLAGRNPDETHLVLSANTKLDDLMEMAEAFQEAAYNRLIITKLDETNELENIFTFVEKVKIPVSYVTTGQSVPEDIEVAVADVFKRFLDREYSHA